MGTFVPNTATVTLQAPALGFDRADLEIYGLDHSKATFEGRVFLNNEAAGPETSHEDPSYAGSFWVFGHGGCAGNEGHCEPVTERRPFDFRLEHQLTPVTKFVTITEALRARVDPGKSFQVTIVPIVRPELAADLPDALVTDLLHFDEVRLLTYQSGAASNLIGNAPQGAAT
jgi:tyrosinase